MVNLLVRIFCCIILLTFSYIPGFIGVHVLANLIHDPSGFNGKLFFILLTCTVLFYLFLLLSFRALTSQGKKENDTLLPPWVMRGFILTLGVFSIFSILLGIRQQDIRFIIFGLSYVIPAWQCYKIIKQRDEDHHLEG